MSWQWLAHVTAAGLLAATPMPAAPVPRPETGTQSVLVPTARPAGDTAPPRSMSSVRFAVIGDTGTGARPQYEVGERLAASHDVFPFEFVIMLGDNIYGSERPQDFVLKFERPYAALLAQQIPFYASLGNHDGPTQRYYKPFNMSGQRYYTFEKGKVRFFALDSNHMDTGQQAWLERELRSSTNEWKIAFFHHPLYSSGGKHGSETDLRAIVEPVFVKYGVSAVFSGHEHFYERVKPQKGIAYFTSGGAAQLRENNIRPNSALTARGFDADLSYMLVEIDGATMHFQTLSRRGRQVDAGDVLVVTARDERRQGDSSGGIARRQLFDELTWQAKLTLPAREPFGDLWNRTVRTPRSLHCRAILPRDPDRDVWWSPPGIPAGGLLARALPGRPKAGQ
jgi:predicted MPP superfamily phosphohydrolase